MLIIREIKLKLCDGFLVFVKICIIIIIKDYVYLWECGEIFGLLFLVRKIGIDKRKCYRGFL